MLRTDSKGARVEAGRPLGRRLTLSRQEMMELESQEVNNEVVSSD